MSGMEDDNKTSNEIVSTFSISCPAPIINAFEDYFAEVLEKYQDSISSELKDTYFSKYKQEFGNKLRDRLSSVSLCELNTNIEKAYDDLQVSVSHKRKTYPAKCASLFKQKCRYETKHLTDHKFHVDDYRTTLPEIISVQKIRPCPGQFAKELKSLAKIIPSTVRDGQNLKVVTSDWVQGAFATIPENIIQNSE